MISHPWLAVSRTQPKAPPGGCPSVAPDGRRTLSGPARLQPLFRLAWLFATLREPASRLQAIDYVTTTIQSRVHAAQFLLRSLDILDIPVTLPISKAA